MLKKIILLLFLPFPSLLSQTWGINNNNNCYGRTYYNQRVPIITYMPQNVYMRPYQYMPQPQPIIINVQPNIPFTPYIPSVIYNRQGNCYRR